MNRTRFVLLCTALLAAACGPVNQPLTCDDDEGCDGILVCREHFCTMPVTSDAGARDAGRVIVDAGPIYLDPVDAGVVDAGTTQEEDAGVVDAGVDAGPVFVDAGPSCVPTVETCNGLDDDCDGFADDSVDLSGFDAGIADAGFAQTAPGQCERGVGACKVSGALVCSNGGITCGATPTAAGVETCNGIDDDCDGEVDEVGAGLCGVAGQLCTAGTCGCPSGTQVCGTSCQVVGSSCSVGVGACRRNGIEQCTGGAVRCDATAGAPAAESCNGIDDDCDAQTDEADPGICAIQGEVCSNATCACPSGQGSCSGICRVLVAETCDGIDNDCNGQTDENVTVTCHVDADNDGYRDNQQVALLCPGANGLCPSGYVGTNMSSATDCAVGDSSKYRFVPSYNDSDGDRWCAGSVSNDCVGAAPLPGRSFASNCLGQADCDETNAQRWQYFDQRVDVDRDGFCIGQNEHACLGTGIDAQHRLTVSCVNNGQADDCDDSATNGPARYRSMTVRPDADADGYCDLPRTNVCVGAAAPTGFKFEAACASTTDCKDSNPNATTTCTLTDRYSTNTNSQACFIGTPALTTTLSVSTYCPAGFHVGSYRPVVTSGGGQCQAQSRQTIVQTCTGFEGTTCKIVGSCVAD